MAVLEPGTAAPDFTLPDESGKPHTLTEALKQGPVLLAFYKDTCPTCQYTLPFVERLHQGLDGAAKVQIWGVSQDDAARTAEFAKEYGCTFPSLVDAEGYPVSNDYGVNFVPTLVLVEPDGKVSHSSFGFDRAALEELATRFGEQTGQAVKVFQKDEMVPDYQPG